MEPVISFARRSRTERDSRANRRRHPKTVSKRGSSKNNRGTTRAHGVPYVTGKRLRKNGRSRSLSIDTVNRYRLTVIFLLPLGELAKQSRFPLAQETKRTRNDMFRVVMTGRGSRNLKMGGGANDILYIMIFKHRFLRTVKYLSYGTFIITNKSRGGN